MIGRLLAVATAAVAVLYGRAWQFDLQCDDLVLIRPWSWAELTHVFHGTWDPHQTFPVFFRPLVSWFFAGSFELFGVHASAHLLLSLALLAAVAFTLALFVARESGSEALGALTAVIYAAHPNTPWSTGIWVMNDFHKLAALAVLVSLLIWQRVRHRGPVAWWPLFVLAAVAFLIKEDNIVLIPALLTAQWARARWLGDVTPPARLLWFSGGAFVSSLWIARWLALQRLGGLPLPDSIEAVARNLLRGPFYALIGQGNPSTGFTIVALGLGAAFLIAIVFAIARIEHRQRWVVILALVLMGWYNAPLMLVSNVTRYYLVTLAGSILLASALASLWASGAASRARRAVLVLAVGVVAVVAVQRQQAILNDFAVCGRLPLECRSFLLEDAPMLPPEARGFTMDMATSCRANVKRHLDQSDTLTWGVGGILIDTMSGSQTRSAEPHVVALLRSSATTATMRIRHLEATAASPIDVAINVNGSDVTQLRLTTPEWTTASVSLTSGWRTWLRGMHRSDIRVTAGGAERSGAEMQPWITRQ